MIAVPEVILFEYLKIIIDYIKKEYEDHQIQESQTFLYNLFYGVTINNGDFDYYVQAKEIFLRGIEHERKINIRRYYDQSIAHLPTMHINLPMKKGRTAIGIDEGYGSYTEDIANNEFQRDRTGMFDTSYNIIISSDNADEVLIIFHTLESAFIALLDIINMSGLQNPILGGGDLQIDPNLVPPHIYHRVLTLDFLFERTVPSTIREKFLKDIEFEMTARVRDEYSETQNL